MVKIDEFLREIRSVRVLNLEAKERLTRLETEAAIKFNEGDEEWLRRIEDKVDRLGIALDQFLVKDK